MAKFSVAIFVAKRIRDRFLH